MRRRYFLVMILFCGCALIAGCFIQTSGLGIAEPGLPGIYVLRADPSNNVIEIRKWGDSRMVYGWGGGLGMPSSWGFMGSVERHGELQINLGEQAIIVWSDPGRSTVGAGAREARILYTPEETVETITFRMSEAGSRAYTLVRTSD